MNVVVVVVCNLEINLISIGMSDCDVTWFSGMVKLL